MEKFTETQIKFLQELLTYNTMKWEIRKEEINGAQEPELKGWCTGFWAACNRLNTYTKQINEKFEIWMKNQDL